MMKLGHTVHREQTMLSVFSNQELVLNDRLKLELAQYVADYIIMEKQENPFCEVDKWMVSDAFDAFLGGAR